MSKEVAREFSLVIRKNSLFMLGQKLITPALKFLLTVYIVRKLTVEAYGIFGVLGTIMDYIILFSAFGLPSIFQRFLPEFTSKNEEGKAKHLINRGLLLSLAFAIIFISIAFLFSDKLGLLLKIEDYSSYFILLIPGIIFYHQALLLGSALTSMFLHKYYVLAQVVYCTFRCGIIFYFLKIGLDLKGVILGEVIAYGMLFLFQAYFYSKKFSGQIQIQEKSKIDVKRLVRYGGFSYFNEMGAKILDVTTDLIIISAFLGPAAAGTYAFAYSIITLFSKAMPHKLFKEVIRPAFFIKFVEDNNRKKLENMVNMLVKFIAFFYLPIVVGIIILGDKIIVHIFDPKYLNALSVLWIVAGFTALNSIQFPLGMVAQAVERPEINFYSKIFSIYNIIANILVINHLGIVGVAIVTCTAILFKNIFMYRFTQKYISYSIDLKPAGRILFNAFVMGLLVYSLKGFVVNLASLMGVVLMGGIFYLMISFINKSFSVKEREIINKILPRPVFVF